MTKRTIAQIEANKIDLSIFRIADDLDRFARDHKSEKASKAAGIVRSARHLIRSHMHLIDVEATQ